MMRPGQRCWRRRGDVAYFARSRISRAIRELTKRGLPVNVNSVARQAKVTRKTIYQHDDLHTLIRAHSHPTAADASEYEVGDQVDKALLQRIADQDSEIAILKAALREREQTIASLRSELSRREP